MLPCLAKLSLNAPLRRGPACRPCGDPFPQPPDYTLPAMDPNDEDGNECMICLYPLNGPAHGEQQVPGQPDVMALERIRACKHQFHRVCLAGWVNQGRDRCPIDRTRILPSEIEGMQLFMGLQPEPEPEPEYVYEGPPEARHLVRVEYPNGTVTHLEGPAGQEYQAYTVFPNGCTVYMEGEAGQEHVVLITYPNGTATHYAGVRGQEHKLRTEFPNGTLVLYEGQRGQESKTSIAFPNGTTQYFWGTRNAEILIRIERADGTVDYYTGPRGRERMDWTNWSSGMHEYYGESGLTLRKEYPAGMVEYFAADGATVERQTIFEGPYGEGRRIRTFFSSDGRVEYYDGPPNAERKVREVYANGRVQLYEGPAGMEEMVSNS